MPEQNIPGKIKISGTISIELGDFITIDEIKFGLRADPEKLAGLAGDRYPALQPLISIIRGANIAQGMMGDG